MVRKRYLGKVIVLTISFIFTGLALSLVDASDRRSNNAKVNDILLNGELLKVVESDLNTKGLDIEFMTFDGSVLIVGSVPDDSIRKYIEQRIRLLTSATRVFNETTVGSDSGFIADLGDSSIESITKGLFSQQTDFNPKHVKLLTKDKVTYLMGSVTRDEANNIVKTASRAKGVKKIVKLFNYLKNKPRAGVYDFGSKLPNISNVDAKVVSRIISKCSSNGCVVYAKGGNQPFTGKFVKEYGSGQKEIETSYVNGKKHGTETYWFKNGKKWKVNNWKYNSKDGVQIVWKKEPIKTGSNNGTDIYESVYSNGKLVSKRKLDFYQDSNLNIASSKIKLKEASLGDTVSSDSFSDLWGEYGGSVLDSKGNIKQQSNYVPKSSADTKAPIISLNQSDFITVESQNFSLNGFIKDDSNISEVNVNGGLIEIDGSGRFDTAMYLGLGKNKFTIEAIDIFGNKASKALTVVRNKAIVKNKDKKLTPPASQLASNPNSIALIIGLDNYKTMPNAPWAESDASAFYDYAHNVLGIPYERIRLITGQESDGIGIWKSLEQWLPSQVDRNKSNIYVYFAGHGLASEDGKDAFLMPYDGDTSMLSRTAIPRKDVIASLDSLKARSVTLFMDTCYSGSAKGGKQTLVASRGLRIVKKNTLSDLPSNFTLFSAAGNDETASSHPSLKHGLFSYWMMRGLGGEADSNQDNKITNGELHAFIDKNVQKSAISIGRKQHPQLIGDKDKVIASW